LLPQNLAWKVLDGGIKWKRFLEVVEKMSSASCCCKTNKPLMTCQLSPPKFDRLFFQVQRRLEGRQRTKLFIDCVCIFSPTQPDLSPIQIKNNIQINMRWWCRKSHQSREHGEEVNSRLRCREYPPTSKSWLFFRSVISTSKSNGIVVCKLILELHLFIIFFYKERKRAVWLVH
jgi:hypothetical protein